MAADKGGHPPPERLAAALVRPFATSGLVEPALVEASLDDMMSTEDLKEYLGRVLVAARAGASSAASDVRPAASWEESRPGHEIQRAPLVLAHCTATVALVEAFLAKLEGSTPPEDHENDANAGGQSERPVPPLNTVRILVGKVLAEDGAIQSPAVRVLGTSRELARHLRFTELHGATGSQVLGRAVAESTNALLVPSTDHSESTSTADGSELSNVDERDDARRTLRELSAALQDPLSAVGNPLHTFTATIAATAATPTKMGSGAQAISSEMATLIDRMPLVIEAVFDALRQPPHAVPADIPPPESLLRFSDTLLVAAIEDNVYSSIYKSVYRATSDSEGDALIAEQYGKHAGLPQSVLLVPPEYQDPSLAPYAEAAAVLCGLPSARTPSRKVGVVRDAARIILRDMQRHAGVYRNRNAAADATADTGMLVGGDDFVPVFVFTLMVARIPRLASEVAFITSLIPAPIRSSEAGYFATTLELACEFIKTLVPRDMAASSITRNPTEAMHGLLPSKGAPFMLALPDVAFCERWAAASAGTVRILERSAVVESVEVVGHGLDVSGCWTVLVKEHLLLRSHPMRMFLEPRPVDDAAQPIEPQRVCVVQLDGTTDAQLLFLLEWVGATGNVPGLSAAVVTVGSPPTTKAVAPVLISRAQFAEHVEEGGRRIAASNSTDSVLPTSANAGSAMIAAHAAPALNTDMKEPLTFIEVDGPDAISDAVEAAGRKLFPDTHRTLRAVSSIGGADAAALLKQLLRENPWTGGSTVAITSESQLLPVRSTLQVLQQLLGLLGFLPFDFDANCAGGEPDSFTQEAVVHAAGSSWLVGPPSNDCLWLLVLARSLQALSRALPSLGTQPTSAGTVVGSPASVRKAIYRFQLHSSLSPDGRLGESTHHALERREKHRRRSMTPVDNR